MGSSAKKKKEKKKDFQKAKLKVGKARPKNTNATDTSFTARSIVIKQQSLSEGSKDDAAVFNHNLSLLTSKSETQRRDSLSYIANYVSTHSGLPVSASSVLGKVLPLILDGNTAVRSQVLKLVGLLPADQLGPVEQTLLYVRAGLTHLSVDIRLHTLDLLDWLLSVKSEEVVSSSGGWIKLLKTFQNLLSWTQTTGVGRDGKWSSVKQPSSMGNSKLLVHQLNTLARLLELGLKTQTLMNVGIDDPAILHAQAHALPSRSNAYGYLNLFASSKDLENELYESAQERGESFQESGLRDAFLYGVENARKDGGESGRAAGGVAKAIALTSND